MKYYKFINLPGWQDVSKLALEHIETRTDFLDQKLFWNELTTQKDSIVTSAIDKMLSNIGLKLNRAMILIIDQPMTPIHQDNYHDGRINIPLKNCQGSRTNFYHTTRWEPINSVLPNGGSYTVHLEENCIFDESVELNSPMILNVQSVHSVITNPALGPRITLSIRTNPDAIILFEEKNV